MRKFCLIRKFTRSLSGKDTFIYFNNIEEPFDTLGQYGFNDVCADVVRVPFTMLEVFKLLGNKCFYNKSEFNYNNEGKLISIKCGNSFLALEKKNKEYSSFSQREINKLMKDNF